MTINKMLFALTFCDEIGHLVSFKFLFIYCFHTTKLHEKNLNDICENLKNYLHKLFCQMFYYIVYFSEIVHHVLKTLLDIGNS